jgi:hypothetical protein
MPKNEAFAVDLSTRTEALRAAGHPNTVADWQTNNEIDEEYRAAYLSKDSLGLHKDWGVYDDYWRGNQNPVENEDDPASVTNVIHPVIESQVADLVDDPKDFIVTGTEPSDEVWAKYAQHVCKWIWEQNVMEVKQDHFERTRMKYGTAVWKTYYDPLGNRGAGKICIDVLTPEKFYCDPKITDPQLVDMADFCGQVDDVSIKYLIRRFGPRARYVRPRMKGIQGITNIFIGDKAADMRSVVSNSATLIEHWSRDEDDKVRVVYKADDVILWDSSWSKKRQQKEGRAYHNPDEGFYQHGHYPFVVVPCYRRDGQLWGMGDVELLIPTQDMINDFDDQIRMNARLMGNIQIVVGLASGINPSKWTNKTGLRVPARDVNAWKIVQPAAMPAYISERREIGKREAETISGRTDVVEGRKPAGIKAASAIIALQEAGNRRVNHKKLMTQVGLSQVFLIAFEHYREFFTETMAMRISGATAADAEQYVWLKGSDFNNIPKLIPDYNAQPNDNGVHPLKQLTKQNLNPDGSVASEEPQTKSAMLDIKISLGEGLPKSKSFQYQAGLELHREQILTTEETRMFFKTIIDWPMIDPFNPQGVFSQSKPELGPDGHPLAPPQPPNGVNAAATGQGGINPQLVQQLQQSLGGSG